MLRDLLYGLRMARRYPGVSVTAILLVALGTGANAAIFAVARTLVYQPLPFDDPGRLVAMWRESDRRAGTFGASWPQLGELQANTRLFHDVAGYLYDRTYSAQAEGGAAAGPVAEIRVTQGFFPLLGLQASSGRLLLADEFLPATAADVAVPVVVSHDFWMRRLGGAPDVLGQPVNVGAWRGTIVGVLPAGVRLFRDDVPEVFSAFRDVPDHYTDRRMTYLQIIARLQPGIETEQLRAELAACSTRMAEEHPATDAGLSWRTENLHDHWYGSRRPTMAVLLGSVGCVLLIVCANLAILLLVRAAERRDEMAMRRALGAGNWRLARQLLAESLVLAAGGGGAGLLAAAWATDAFVIYSQNLGLGLPPIRIDATVVGCTLLLSIATGLLFGAAPAVGARRLGLGCSLKPNGPTPTVGRLSRTAATALVVLEIAVSTIVLIGAGLLVRTLERLNSVDPGFETARVMAVSIGRPPQAPDSRQRDHAFWAQLLERARALPGAESVALCGAVPLASDQAPENMKLRVAPEGRVLAAPGYVEAEYQDVSPDYFRVIGVPIRYGRTFTGSVEDSHAVIVSEGLAREAWGVGDAVGRRMVGPGGRVDTVVGVVGDVRQYRLRAAVPVRQVYRSVSPSDISTFRRWPGQYVLLRTRGDRSRVAAMVKAAVRSIDPERPVVSVRPLDEIVFRSTGWDRLKTTVVALFGATAFLLTLVGMAAVLAHAVSKRRREIAIRMALGGNRGDIRRMVLRQGAPLVLAGLLIGLLAASGLARLAASQLFEVRPFDPPTYAAVALLLGLSAFAACYLPLRQAMRVDASEVMRSE